jgi:DNA-binding response OmpR family regulator
MTPDPSPVVLVVEDDPGIREPLVRFLEFTQFQPVAVGTVEEGLDAIEAHHPVAAIVDLKLPSGSGREVVVSMPPERPVIIFSGWRDESADLERLRPRTRLVEKPYSLVQLMDVLNDMLGTPGAR